MNDSGVHRKEDPIRAWLEDLELRHRAELSFAEIRRAVQALSSLYVERRGHASPRRAFETAGKRAAYSLFYAPLHFLTVREIVRGLGAGAGGIRKIVDLGCGTGAAGAAWAIEAGGAAEVEGIDRSPWAIEEARRTLLALGLRGRMRRGPIERARLSGQGSAIVAAWSVNEMEDSPRDALLEAILEAAERGARVLIVEPVSKRVSPWWPEWARRFASASGREDSWRVRSSLPETLRLLDRAAGLDHRELKARSLWLEPRSGAPHDGRHARRRETPIAIVSRAEVPSPSRPSTGPAREERRTFVNNAA